MARAATDLGMGLADFATKIALTGGFKGLSKAAALSKLPVAERSLLPKLSNITKLNMQPIKLPELSFKANAVKGPYQNYFDSKVNLDSNLGNGIIKDNTFNSLNNRSGINIELKYKDGWTLAQKAAADIKINALTRANTVKKPVIRNKTSASSSYKFAFGKDSIPQGYDIDHIIDLQLGGEDNIFNMKPLDLSVNRSLGSQIKNAIKKYDFGTPFDKFTIK